MLKSWQTLQHNHVKFVTAKVRYWPWSDITASYYDNNYSFSKVSQ